MAQQQRARIAVSRQIISDHETNATDKTEWVSSTKVTPTKSSKGIRWSRKQMPTQTGVNNYRLQKESNVILLHWHVRIRLFVGEAWDSNSHYITAWAHMCRHARSYAHHRWKPNIRWTEPAAWISPAKTEHGNKSDSNLDNCCRFSGTTQRSVPHKKKPEK